MSSLTLPSSGRVLAFVIGALDLRASDSSGELVRSSARRYLRGERVGEDAQKRVHRAFAAALVEAELLPATLDPRPLLHPDQRAADGLLDSYRPATGDLLALLLAFYAQHWDALVAAVRQRTAPVAFPRHMAEACIRLVVADLAVRTCGLLWLMRAEDGAPVPAFWYEKRGIETWLRDVVDRSGLTRDGLASAVRVHANTVDGWLDQGTRPSDENLRDLALAFGEHGEDAPRLLRSLRLAFLGRSVLDEVDRLIPGDAREAARRYVRWSNLLVTFVRSSRNPIENDFKMMMAMLAGTLPFKGTRLPWVEYLLKPVWRTETDPTWRTSIVATTHSWLDNLQFVAARLGPSAASEARSIFGSIEHPTVAELLNHVQAAPSEVAREPAWAQAPEAVLTAGGPVAATQYKHLAAEAGDRNDLLESAEFLRWAVECDATDPDSHFRLGATLGQLSDVATAVGELEIAVALAPDWDRPRVELAIVHLNHGRDAEALLYLEKAASQLTVRTPWLLFHLAVAQEQLHKHEAAIETLKELLAAHPELGEAHDRLAHLYMVTGERAKGRNHAKQAAHCGHGSVLAALEAGYYRGSRAKPRPPSVVPDHLVQSSARPRSDP